MVILQWSDLIVIDKLTAIYHNYMVNHNYTVNINVDGNYLMIFYDIMMKC